MVRRRKLLVSLAACVVLQASTAASVCAAATGQTVGTSAGAINGQVTDASGGVLPGVTITISSDAVIGGRGSRTTVTDKEGSYRFQALSPGDYSLVFTLEGFRTLNRQDIHVGLGFTATVNVELDIAALNQSLSVEHKSPVIDTHSTAITINFAAGPLANLPGSRSTFAILSATPAVQVAHFEVGGGSGDGGGQYSAYGTRGGNRPSSVDTTQVRVATQRSGMVSSINPRAMRASVIVSRA